MEQLSLNVLERQMYLSYHQDGLIDIAAGTVVLLFGLSMLMDIPWLAGTWVIFAMLIYVSAKQRITYPRIGAVQLGEAQRWRLSLTILALVGAVFLAFIIGAWILMRTAEGPVPPWLSAALNFLGSYFMVVLGLAGMAIAALFAYQLHIPRFYGYAAMILLLFLLGFWADIPLAAIVIGLGILITCTGGIVLARFMANVPLIEEAEAGRKG